MLSDLDKTATLLEGHLGSSLGLKLLGKAEAFQFFSYLFNLEEWSGRDQLRSDTGVDRQIVKSPVAWHSDHVQIGKRHVQMFSLKTTPEASRPCLFSGLLTLDCDSVVCSTWRVKSTSAARSEIDAQEKFISFFKVGVLTRVMSGRDTASTKFHGVCHCKERNPRGSRQHVFGLVGKQNMIEPPRFESFVVGALHDSIVEKRM
jgi:type IV secretion system protein VirB4